MFFNNILDFYENSKKKKDNDKDKDDVLYDYIINKDTNIFKKLFDFRKKTFSFKIFYRLGLLDHDFEDDSNKYVFNFGLNKYIVRKMSLVNSFIIQMINCLKIGN